MVKRQNISAYFKGKNFYMTLLMGICAVFAIALIYTSVASNKQSNLVDLNEPPVDVASSENKVNKADMTKQQIQENVSNAAVNPDDTSRLAGKLKDSLLENDIVSEPKKDTVQTAKAPVSAKAEEVVDTSTITVMNPKNTSNLKFDEEAGLLWPVNGNIILGYNMESPIVHFETLNQYKCNPAVMISGDVDTEVLSAAKGIVTELSENEETGLTLTMAIGSDYSVKYGQIKDCTLKIGDAVAEGDIIGKIAEPTKYYVIEGSNLYFQVTQKDKTVDPMLLLR